jgi:tRNA U38,U39,U40 pseudouridine synthase TruA
MLGNNNSFHFSTGSFHAYLFPFLRTYTYLMPTYGFAPAFPTAINSTNISPTESSDGGSDLANQVTEDFVTSLVIQLNVFIKVFQVSRSLETLSILLISKQDFRLTPELREKVNQVLKSFVGHHYFHNYTSGK